MFHFANLQLASRPTVLPFPSPNSAATLPLSDPTALTTPGSSLDCLLPDVFHLACPPLCESVSFPFERMNYFFFQHLGFFYLSRYEFICKHRFETLNTTVLNNDPGAARLGNRFEEPAELLSLLHSPTSTHRVQFSHILFPLFASMTTLSPFFFSHYRKRLNAYKTITHFGCLYSPGWPGSCCVDRP